MLNKVLLIGNLVDDPRPLRTLPSGAVVTDVRMAVNDPRDRGRDRGDERTVFIDVTVWNRTAENVAKFLSKGRQVLVDGRLEQDSWEDKETGQRRSKIKVVAFQVTFMGSRDGEGGGGGGGGYDRDDDYRGGGGGRDDRDHGSGGGGGYGGRQDRGGGGGSRDDSGGSGGSSPLKDYGLDDEVPF